MEEGAASPASIESLAEVTSTRGLVAPKKRKLEGLADSTRLTRKKKVKRIGEGEDETLNLEQAINTSIGKYDNRLLADFVAQRTKRFNPGLTLLELEDIHLPEQAFRDTSGFVKPRILGNLPAYLTDSVSEVKKQDKLISAPKTTGSPHTIIITAAGLRAADISRALRTFQSKDAIVGKLFAKHIKLKEAINYVKKTRMGIGVGTPTRIIDLLDADALSCQKLERIVVDCSHIDQKKRGIFDMKETQQPLMRLLNREQLKNRYGKEQDGIDLLFY